MAPRAGGNALHRIELPGNERIAVNPQVRQPVAHLAYLGGADGAGLYLVDCDLQHHAQFCAAHGNRADQTVPVVVLRVMALLQWNAFGGDIALVERGKGVQPPATIERAADHGVTRTIVRIGGRSREKQP